MPHAPKPGQLLAMHTLRPMSGPTLHSMSHYTLRAVSTQGNPTSVLDLRVPHAPYIPNNVERAFSTQGSHMNALYRDSPMEPYRPKSAMRTFSTQLCLMNLPNPTTPLEPFRPNNTIWAFSIEQHPGNVLDLRAPDEPSRPKPAPPASKTKAPSLSTRGSVGVMAAPSVVRYRPTRRRLRSSRFPRRPSRARPGRTPRPRPQQRLRPHLPSQQPLPL